MSSAALKALYSKGTAGQSRTCKLSYQDLLDDDMKKLVRVLRDAPFPCSPEKFEGCIHDVKDEIRDLPPHLRSSPHHRGDGNKRGYLCSTHGGLNVKLIYNIWKWVKFEFDHGVGHFLWPIIIRGGLTRHQELRARQLEPVLEMWHDDFDVASSAPKGREPIIVNIIVDGVEMPKWHFQKNQCLACMLARLGSDAVVLSSLLSGMVGRFPSQKVGHRYDILSKRVSFVRYWLKAHEGGNDMVDESWNFGKEMRRMRKAWRNYIKSSWQPELDGQVLAFDSTCRLANSLLTSEQRTSASALSDDGSQQSIFIGVDFSETFIPSTAISTGPSEPLTWNPVASSIYSRTTQGVPINSCSAGNSGQHPATHGFHDLLPHEKLITSSPRVSEHNLYVQEISQGRAEDVSTPASSINSQQAHFSCASIDSSTLINSWNELPSYANELSEEERPPLHFAPLRASNTSRESVREEAMHLPQPNRRSMYAAFGDPSFRYEDAGACNDGPVRGAGPSDPRTRTTQWSELY